MAGIVNRRINDPIIGLQGPARKQQQTIGLPAHRALIGRLRIELRRTRGRRPGGIGFADHAQQAGSKEKN